MQRKFPAQVRADVQRFYGLNVDDVGYEFSFRHLADLVACLPRESATLRAYDSRNEWSIDTHLLASVLDVLRWIQWSKTAKGAKNQGQPKPVPRPGYEDAGKVKDSVALPVDEVERLLRLPRM